MHQYPFHQLKMLFDSLISKFWSMYTDSLRALTKHSVCTMQSNEVKSTVCVFPGPTLLFKRYYSDKEPRQFYACAVHRDRKGCSFFHWADEKPSTEKLDR